MKKSRRILSIILTALMVVTMLPLSVMPASASAAADLTVTIDTGASVTLKDTDADGYYDIGTADELYAFAAAINSGKDGVNGELTANIVVNKNVLTANGDLNGNGSDFRVWTPIGYEVSSADREYFEGLFDGNNYTISGLYYNGSAMLVGLFGYGYGATIRNVGIIDSYMCSNYSDTSSRGYIGGVAATFNYDGVSMENCYNKGTIIATTDRVYAGGVVGNIYSIEKISNSYNTGKVVGKSYVGGVVGRSTYSSLIDCYNTGDISGDEYVGGIAGYASLGKNYVEKCYNTGNINCKGNYAGGIIAYLSGSYSTSYDRAITKCYNTGNINSSGNYVGGLAGRSDSYKSIIRNSYNVGDVSGIKYVGGIVGENSYFVQNCYNLGDVSGTSYVGGVSGGKVGNNSAIQNCYYLTDTATGGIGGLDAVGEAEVKTAEQFASGEIAYLLQGEQTEQVWGQSIGSDTLPVFATESNKVYFVSNCQNDTGYSNTQNEEGGHIVGDLATCKTQAVCAVCGTNYGELDPDNHEYETNNGICCDTYQSAALNAEGFYEIFNAGQLFWFAQQVNIEGNTTANGKLMADIDLEGRTWYPIGVYNDAVDAGGTIAKVMFKGTLDGGGHTVSNFTATGTGSQGLVGYSDTTVVVKNLGVINATVSGWNAGAVLAYQGTVENCYAINCEVTGYTTATDAEGVFAGAVAGSQSPTVKNSFAYNCQVIAGAGMTVSATLAPVGGELVSNSYYVNVAATNGTFRSHVGETAKTAEQFASGEVAYLLGSAWGQTIGTDSYPVPGGDKVYYGYTSCGDDEKDYTNDETVYETKPEHNFDSKGFCTECENGYQPAELKDGYYQIANAGQLFWFAKYINTVDRTASAVLVDDIDLENRPWSPIGFTSEKSNNFRGHFDGQGHTITGLYVEGDRAGLGFFGEVRTGTVENFTIYGEVVVNKEYNYVGGVIGSACGLNSSDHGLERNGATIRNITSYVNLTAGAHGIGMVGGFIGYANHETLIENCSWYGNFDAGIYRVDSGAGGFIGRIYDSASVTIRNCAAYGTITTEYKSGTFESKDDIYIGGFLSYSPSGAQTVMENNLWAGRITNNTNLSAENAHLSAYGTLTSFKSVTNCYMEEGSAAYITTSNVNTDGITTVTAAQLKSGEIAYLLQGEQTEEIWGQKIGTDDYPVLGGAKVYQVTNCKDEAVYSNTNENIGHSYENGTCTVCGTTVFSLINGAAFDSTDSYIYGFAPGITSLDDYTEILVDGYEWTYTPGQFGGFGTGTKATLKNSDETVAEYIVLIYGDLNGDGWYDGEDAFLTNLIVKGMLKQADLPEYMWMAADCNHDGVINETDVDILTGAGLKLNSVDQNAAQSELSTQAAYIEYMSIIDQSAGLDIEPDTDETQQGTTTPETNETVEPDEPAEDSYFGIFISKVFLFIRKIFNFVFSFVIK